jgi:hypothetical protein
METLLHDPTLTFVTSLRHPDSSRDYGRVLALLARTLRSLDAQTDRRCRVVVVANQPPHLPSGLTIDARVVHVDFPAPTPPAGGRSSIEQVRRDKGTKLAVGLAEVEGGHVMLLDADDYVHKDLTRFVAEHPESPGWFIDDGLMYDSRTGLCLPVPRFNTVCGSSLVVRRDLLPTARAGCAASQDEVLQDVGEQKVLRWLGSHRFLAEDLALEPLPFVGAVYDVNNGENHSQKKMPSAGRPLWPTRAAEFGISNERPVAMSVHAALAVARGGLARAKRRLGRGIIRHAPSAPRAPGRD